MGLHYESFGVRESFLSNKENQKNQFFEGGEKEAKTEQKGGPSP